MTKFFNYNLNSDICQMQEVLHSKIVGKGKPLLILHGFLGSGDNWISLARKFASQFEVHIIDLRNHGRSFHADEMNFGLMCKDVYQYCQQNDLKDIAILGHSMGGKIGMHIAVNHPELVSKLIVADIAPKSYKRGHDSILDALNAIDFSIHKTREAVAKIIAKYVESEPIRLFLQKNVYRKGKDALAFRFNLPVLMQYYDEFTESLPTDYQFDGEVLFLKGALSDYILGSDIDLIESHFPNADIVAIANAGHWLHAENPAEFYNYSLEFLLQ